MSVTTLLFAACMAGVLVVWRGPLEAVAVAVGGSFVTGGVAAAVAFVPPARELVRTQVPVAYDAMATMGLVEPNPEVRVAEKGLSSVFQGVAEQNRRTRR